MAETESPPPTTVTASISDNTFAIAFVPLAKFSNSNTDTYFWHSSNTKYQNQYFLILPQFYKNLFSLQ